MCVLLLAFAGCDQVFGLNDPVGPDATVPLGCPAEFGANRYLLVETLLDWKSAELACEALDLDPDDEVHSHLAVINSADELLLIPRASADAWAGLVDRASTGAFEWITDEPTGPIPWGATEPNSSSSGPKCGEVDMSKPEIGDSGCPNSQPYFCECDGYPAIAARMY